MHWLPLLGLDLFATPGAQSAGSTPSIVPSSIINTGSLFSDQMLQQVVEPFLTALQYLAPAVVLLMALHQVIERKESAGAMLLEILVKGGGLFLVIGFIKGLAGL